MGAAFLFGKMVIVFGTDYAIIKMYNYGRTAADETLYTGV